MEKIDFLFLSKRDIRDAKHMLDVGSYESACRFSQQAVEKFLKHYIQKLGDTSDIGILSSHGLVNLYTRYVALSNITLLKEDRKMMGLLQGYYFDLNYPGDRCREVDKEEAQEAYDFSLKFIQQNSEDNVLWW